MWTTGRQVASALSLTGLLALAAACGSSAKGGTAAGPSSPGATTTSAAPGATGSGADLVPVRVKVRVLNVAAGSDRGGQPIDVWTGTGIANSSSEKLATVGYGTESGPLTPKRSSYVQARTVNGKQVYGYSLTFAPHGATSQDVALLQSEDAFPGDELTIVVSSDSSSSTSTHALRDTVYFTKATDHGDGTRTTFQDMAAPSGTKLVAMDGHGLDTPPYDPSNPDVTAFDLTSGSACLPEVMAKGAPQLGTNSRWTISADGTPDFAYVVKSGASSVDVVSVPPGVSSPDQLCSKKVATVDLPASAGDRAIIFLYGDPTKPDSVVLPG